MLENKIKEIKMKKIVILICLLALVSMSLFGQEGKYVRKSISSVEAVWVKPGAVQSGVNFDVAYFNKMVKHYIEIPRFDYNQLPPALVKDFINQANALSSLQPQDIANLMEKTIGVQIATILNDPKVQEMRGKNIKNESASQSFAATKGKSMGLTFPELETLMNSAFIYLPYISKMQMATKDNTINFQVDGGIVWFQVKVNADNTVSVKQRVAASSFGMSSATPGAKNILGVPMEYKTYQFGNETLPTTPQIWVQYDAVQALVKNLGVKTKEIVEFKLSAQVLETKGDRIGISMGKKEGIHMDDTFEIMQSSENAAGEVKSTSVGYVRVIKTGDNVADPTAMSYSQLWKGKNSGVGSVLIEKPKLGLDILAKIKIMSGMSIKEKLAEGEEPVILDGTGTSGAGLDVIFAYNLAPIVGKPQTFLNLGFGFGVPNVSVIKGYDASTYLYSGFLGVTKKFWMKDMGFRLQGDLGMDFLGITGSYSDEYTPSYDYTIKSNCLSLKLEGGIEYLIQPDLIVNLGVGYKVATSPLSTTFEVDGQTYSANTTLFDEVDLGGLNVNFGVSYSLSELPINLFGFLDPFKKY